MGVHEANKCEDANIFFQSFLQRRKTGEDFFSPNPNYKAKGNQACLLGFNVHVLRGVSVCVRVSVSEHALVKCTAPVLWMSVSRWTERNLRAWRRGLTYIKTLA